MHARSVVIAALLFLAPPLAQADAASDVLAVQRAWLTALRDKDAKALGALTAEHFASTGIKRWQEPLGKAGYVDNALTKYEMKSFALGDPKVALHGPHTAIVQANITFDATYSSESASGTHSIADVWVLEDGRWRIAAHIVAPAVEAR